MSKVQVDLPFKYLCMHGVIGYDLPCIKDKCLKFPICMSKWEIDCLDLFNWLHLKQESYNKERWGIMRNHLKKVQTITCSGPGIGKIVI